MNDFILLIVLGCLAEVYVDQMRDGMPIVENAVEALGHLEKQRSMEDAVALYCNGMKGPLHAPTWTPLEFSKLHHEFQLQSIAMFSSKVIFDDDRVYLNKLTVRIFNLNNDFQSTHTF